MYSRKAFRRGSLKIVPACVCVPAPETVLLIGTSVLCVVESGTGMNYQRKRQSRWFRILN